jgi:hypothetical protein
MLLKYTGDDERYYPSLSLAAKPGITADLAEDPGDGRWQTVSDPAPTAVSAPDSKEAVNG